MDSLFTSVLEISWQTGLIALAVMAVRPLLRRAPRRAVCMLWLLVALRLLLPARLTVESPVSLQQPESPPIQAYQELRQQEKVYVSAPPEQRPEMAGPAAAQGFALLDQLPAIWLTGVGCMALYMALSLLRMRWRLRAAPRIQDNVYRCTDWSTPFVLGVLAPRIYVPETVSEQDFPQVLAHERCHIHRWDHVWKPLAFLLLAVNWFNPVLWAAYVLLGRDMESACDEMVLKNATPSQRAAYSRALVSCAAQPKMAAVCPLAFGEVAVKERVKNVLNYKKPALWAVILLVVAAAIIGVCLLTKPAENDAGVPDAETLYALRTEYIGDNSAVSGILDALGFRAPALPAMVRRIPTPLRSKRPASPTAWWCATPSQARCRSAARSGTVRWRSGAISRWHSSTTRNGCGGRTSVRKGRLLCPARCTPGTMWRRTTTPCGGVPRACRH